MLITTAMFSNSITAANTGWGVQLILHARRIDPAIAGSVILTTFTDIVALCYV
ncbi:MAG: magnesium transporter [Arenicella sp.]|jgi:magnesium transporter